MNPVSDGYSDGPGPVSRSAIWPVGPLGAVTAGRVRRLAVVTAAAAVFGVIRYEPLRLNEVPTAFLITITVAFKAR